MRERRGKKQLYYTDGKKDTCDYNVYNDNFLNNCINTFFELTVGNISDILECIKHLAQLILLIVVILTFPISIPVMATMRNRVIKKRNKLNELEEWKIGRFK